MGTKLTKTVTNFDVHLTDLHIIFFLNAIRLLQRLSYKDARLSYKDARLCLQPTLSNDSLYRQINII